MAQTLKLFIKPHIFSEEKFLIINPGFIEYETINLSKFEIAEVRYAAKRINLYWFKIGLLFCIDIKSVSGRIIKIRMLSLFKIKRKQSQENYTKIIAAVQENYMNDILQSLWGKFSNKIEFDILGVTFTSEGLQLDNNSAIILWDDLGNRVYKTYYSLFSKANPEKYKNFNYWDDWNTALLYFLSRHILKTKNLL